jgi:hypothetical protein
MKMEEAVFPCAAFVVFLVIVFGFLAFVRYMRYREMIALAEKGVVAPPRRNGNGKDTLRWGILVTAIGLALIVGLIPVAWRDSWPLMLIGLIPTFFGIGLVLIYVLTREEESQEQDSDELEPLPRSPGVEPVEDPSD